MAYGIEQIELQDYDHLLNICQIFLTYVCNLVPSKLIETKEVGVEKTCFFSILKTLNM